MPVRISQDFPRPILLWLTLQPLLEAFPHGSIDGASRGRSHFRHLAFFKRVSRIKACCNYSRLCRMMNITCCRILSLRKTFMRHYCIPSSALLLWALYVVELRKKWYAMMADAVSCTHRLRKHLIWEEFFKNCLSHQLFLGDFSSLLKVVR